MILVTGDVVLDHDIYEGIRMTPQAPPGGGSRYREIPGGAMLTYGLLKALDPARARFGLKQTTAKQLRAWPEQFHARALWKSVANGPKPEDGHHWALERRLGYGELSEIETYPGDLAADFDAEAPRILVIDDGSLGFREASHCWPGWLSEDKRPAVLEWVILKTARPLASGTLWQKLMRDTWRERLIVIVNADELRQEGLRVAGGLSWETSVDDIVDELESNHLLTELGRCRHLFVT